MNTSLGGCQAVHILDRLAETSGLPEVTTVYSEPEFAGEAVDEWASRTGVKLQFIQPEKPTAVGL